LSVKIPSDFSLREGERPVWYGRRSFKSVVGYTIPGIVLLIFGGFWVTLIGLGFVTFGIIGGVLLLIAIILLILAHRKVATTEYFITNLRTYVRYGSIVTELENESITYVGVLQSALGRLMNYGNVIISTPGRAGAVTMVGVSDPMRVRQVLLDAVDRRKKVKEIEERIREIEHEHELGRITEEKYRELKSKYEEELKKYM